MNVTIKQEKNCEIAQLLLLFAFVFIITYIYIFCYSCLPNSRILPNVQQRRAATKQKHELFEALL